MLLHPLGFDGISFYPSYAADKKFIEKEKRKPKNKRKKHSSNLSGEGGTNTINFEKSGSKKRVLL